MPVQGEHAFAEVVEPGMGGVALRRRPIESVGTEARVLAVNVASAAEHDIEAGIASRAERLIGALASFLRRLEKTAIAFGELAPFVIGREAPTVA